MKVIAYGEKYPCTRAVKTEKSIKLYDGENCIVSFDGISNFDGYSVEGGEWETPEPTETEQLRADVDFIMAMEGLL